MANVFTALAPVLFSAAQTVSNEPFGVISAIDARFDDKGVAIGDTVRVPVAPMRVASNYNPAMVFTAGDDATAQSVNVTITNNRFVSWTLSGEQLRSLENANSDKEWVRQMIAQGMRALRNEAEILAAATIKAGASRAVGSAGITPFATDLSALTNVRKVLQDNGAPLADLQFIGDTNCGLALRNLNIIQFAYQAGSDEERRSGVFLRQFGFKITESAGIGLHTAGTGSGYLVNNGPGYLVRDTAIALGTGTGTVLPGDIVTFAGDTNKYVAGSALAAPGTETFSRPGLRKVLANGVAASLGASYTANLAFERSSTVCIMRPPLLPPNPLMTQQSISDSTGMTYLLVAIAGDGMVTWRLHIAYGFAVVQPEHVAIVLG